MAAIQWLLAWSTSTTIALYGLRLPSDRRKLVSVIFVLSSLYNMHVSSKLDMDPNSKIIFGFVVLFFFLHMTSVLWLRDVEACDSWSSAYKIAYNVRWIGTAQSPIQGGCYRSSRCYRKASRVTNKEQVTPPHTCQSRMEFVGNRMLSLVQLYTLTVFYNQIIDPEGRIGFTAADFASRKSSFWRRLLSSTTNDMDVKREFLVRIHLSFDGIVQVVSGMIGLHDVLATGFVLLGIDEPDEWPPLFGHLGDVVSIRSYYADFWHHLHYRSTLTYSRSIMNFLGITGHTNLTKLCLTFLVFTISGLNHCVVSCINTQQLIMTFDALKYWWLLLSLIVLEDYVKLAYSAVCPPADMHSNPTRRNMERALGRVWVLFVFFSILPKSNYNGAPVRA